MRSEHQLITAVLIDVQVRCSELQEFFVDGTSTSPGAQWSYIAHLLPMRQSPAPVGLQAEVITRLAAIPRLRRTVFHVPDVAEVPLPSLMQHIVPFGALVALEVL